MEGDIKKTFRIKSPIIGLHLNRRTKFEREVPYHGWNQSLIVSLLCSQSWKCEQNEAYLFFLTFLLLPFSMHSI